MKTFVGLFCVLGMSALIVGCTGSDEESSNSSESSDQNQSGSSNSSSNSSSHLKTAFGYSDGNCIEYTADAIVIDIMLEVDDACNHGELSLGSCNPSGFTGACDLDEQAVSQEQGGVENPADTAGQEECAQDVEIPAGYGDAASEIQVKVYMAADSESPLSPEQLCGLMSGTYTGL